jgi:hypothetical protein
MKTRSCAACLAVAIMAAVAPGASAETTSVSTPFAGELTSSCTGEPFAAQGTMHVKTTADPTAIGLKYQIETNITGVTGRTLSGVQYVSNDQTSDMTHADSDDAQVTFEQTIVLIRQGETTGLIPGKGDDLQFKLLTHLTVSNGVTRAVSFELRDDCR